MALKHECIQTVKQTHTHTHVLALFGGGGWKSPQRSQYARTIHCTHTATNHPPPPPCTKLLRSPSSFTNDTVTNDYLYLSLCTTSVFLFQAAF